MNLEDPYSIAAGVPKRIFFLVGYWSGQIAQPKAMPWKVNPIAKALLFHLLGNLVR